MGEHRKPHWDGKTTYDIDPKGWVVPVLNGLPYMILLHNCEDAFMPVFSSHDLLMKHLAVPHVSVFLGQNFGEKIDVQVMEVTNPNEFCKTLWGNGVRLMLDPDSVSPTHTRWKEVVSGADNLLKYIDPEQS
jgi:hypothetical protein